MTRAQGRRRPPTSGEANHATGRAAANLAVHEAVTAALAADGPETQLFMVSLPLHYRRKPHPVLGPVDVDAVIGVTAPYRQHAVDWVRHWLGTRGFADVLDFDTWLANCDTWPGGCPVKHDAPPARHYRHPNWSRIVVWDDGMEAYGADGKRKQCPATATQLAEGYGAWRETWFDHDGVELTAGRVAAICKAAGVIAR